MFAHHWPSDVFALCAVSRHWHLIVIDWLLRLPRNGANRKSMAIFPVTVFRGRALSVSATINQPRVFPRPLATINNAETRDLGLKTRVVVRCPRTTSQQGSVPAGSAHFTEMRPLKVNRRGLPPQESIPKTPNTHGRVSTAFRFLRLIKGPCVLC